MFASVVHVFFDLDHLKNMIGLSPMHSGFKMSCMKEEVLRDASVTVVDPYSIISSSDTIKVRKGVKC